VKAVILAGGMGSRISEETVVRPKPMVEIGGKPLLWHIMKSYSMHGITEFVVCLGYRGYQIKEYFANYHLHMSDVTFDLAENAMSIHGTYAEPWRVTLIDTGDATMTGGRLRRVLPHLGDEEFCFTYGDGVSDLDVTALIDFHRESGLLATVTAVQPPGRFGALDFSGDRVAGFQEKPQGDGGWVNGGFFVLSPEVGRYIDGDETIWEQQPLQRLAADGQLAAYRHTGFWYAMDTLRDRNHLQELWESGAPWRTWDSAR
jgi:glucose-1-phosphate cytidylyltransferase